MNDVAEPAFFSQPGRDALEWRYVMLINTSFVLHFNWLASRWNRRISDTARK